MSKHDWSEWMISTSRKELEATLKSESFEREKYDIKGFFAKVEAEYEKVNMTERYVTSDATQLMTEYHKRLQYFIEDECDRYCGVFCCGSSVRGMCDVRLFSEADHQRYGWGTPRYGPYEFYGPDFDINEPLCTRCMIGKANRG